MSYTQEELNRAYTRARMEILSKDNCAFIATVLLGLRDQFATKLPSGQPMPTAATNGLDMWVNPDYFMWLESQYRPSLNIHEAWHPALMHTVEDMWGPTRQDHDLRNRAGDLRLNVYVKQLGFPIHPDWLYEDKYVSDQWTTISIYDDLVKRQKAGEKFKPNPLDGDLQVPSNNPAPGDSGPSAQEVAANVEDLLARAAIVHKQKNGDWGNLPGEVQTFLEKLLEPKLNPQVLLRNYMSEIQRTDYSMKRVNRRYLPDFYLPTLYNERVANLVYVVDVSGSVTETMEQHILSEIEFARQTLNPEKTTIISFNTRVTDIHELAEYDLIGDFRFESGGGTNIYPAFEKLNEINPTVAVIFSDLCCRKYTEPTPYPVIWIRMGDYGFQPSFGEVVQYDGDW